MQGYVDFITKEGIRMDIECVVYAEPFGLYEVFVGEGKDRKSIGFFISGPGGQILGKFGPGEGGPAMEALEAIIEEWNRQHTNRPGM